MEIIKINLLFNLTSPVCGAQTVLMMLMEKILSASKSLQEVKKSKGFLKTGFEEAFCDKVRRGKGGKSPEML
jgi:hypothetical protein